MECLACIRISLWDSRSRGAGLTVAKPPTCGRSFGTTAQQQARVTKGSGIDVRILLTHSFYWKKNEVKHQKDFLAGVQKQSCQHQGFIVHIPLPGLDLVPPPMNGAKMSSHVLMTQDVKNLHGQQTLRSPKLRTPCCHKPRGGACGTPRSSYTAINCNNNQKLTWAKQTNIPFTSEHSDWLWDKLS